FIQNRGVSATGSFRVLLVEDDPDTRANLSDILELDGYVVECTSSLGGALARDDWSKIDVVLLDRRLPDGNAEEILPRLRELAPEAAVMVVTAHGDLESAMRAIQYGAVEYILK